MEAVIEYRGLEQARVNPRLEKRAVQGRMPGCAAVGATRWQGRLSKGLNRAGFARRSHGVDGRHGDLPVLDSEAQTAQPPHYRVTGSGSVRRMICPRSLRLDQVKSSPLRCSRTACLTHLVSFSQGVRRLLVLDVPGIALLCHDLVSFSIQSAINSGSIPD